MPQRGGLWRRLVLAMAPSWVGGDVALVLHLPPHPGAGGDLGPIFLLLGCLIPLGVYRRPPGPPWWSGCGPQRTKAPHPPHFDRIFAAPRPPILRDWRGGLFWQSPW